MVIAAVVAGLAISSSGSARAEDAEGLQVDVISTIQHQGTHHYNKQVGSYPVNSSSCALRLRTSRWPCGTSGRALVNSTL
jgi:hypothetical protein